LNCNNLNLIINYFFLFTIYLKKNFNFILGIDSRIDPESSISQNRLISAIPGIDTESWYFGPRCSGLRRFTATKCSIDLSSIFKIENLIINLIISKINTVGLGEWGRGKKPSVKVTNSLREKSKLKGVLVWGNRGAL
jgi:hypothetical protein